MLSGRGVIGERGRHRDDRGDRQYQG
jgi:hypothetical protein